MWASCMTSLPHMWGTMCLLSCKEGGTAGTREMRIFQAEKTMVSCFKKKHEEKKILLNASANYESGLIVKLGEELHILI